MASSSCGPVFHRKSCPSSWARCSARAAATIGRMRVLFIHQNIPGQFRHVIGALCADAGNSVWAIGGADAAQRAGALFPRLNLVSYTVPAAPAGGHPWLVDVDAQLRRGQVVARAMQQVKDKGVGFDVIVAHPGWGEAMFVKDVF